MKSNYLGISLVFLACLIWSLDTLIRYPLVGQYFFPVEQLVFFEHLFLVIFISPLVFKNIKKIFSCSKKDFGAFFLIGGIGSALSTIFFTKAFVYLNPSIVIVIQKFQLFFAIFLAKVLLKEKLDKKYILSALIAFIGGLLLVEKTFFSSIDFNKLQLTDANSLKGLFFSIIAVMGWGASTVVGKYLTLQKYKTEEILVGRFFWGFVVSSFFMFFINIKFEQSFFVKVGFLALLSGIFAMWLFYKALKSLPARICSIAELSFPVFAIIVNWIFLEKSLVLNEIIGAFLILLGVAIAGHFQEKSKT